MDRISVWCVGLACGLVLIGCGRPPSPTPSTVAPVTAVPAAHEVVPLAEPAAGDWPWWRGPSRNGISADQTAPTTWSETENVIWKTDVPGTGHSSPTVVGTRVFLATSDEGTEEQTLLCFDRATGEKQWSTRIHKGSLGPKHPKNTHASASAACDGERVYITFANAGAVWLTATDLVGNILYQTEAGKFSNGNGFAASPSLWGSLVIVAGDGEGTAFLAGIHRKSGTIVWRVGRSAGVSYSSPNVALVAGKPQVLLSGGEKVCGYNPDDGSLLWTCDGTADSTSGTMTFLGDLAFASGGYPQNQTVCVRADGSGDVTGTKRMWDNNEKFYVPSLLATGNRLYGVDDGGIAFCFDAVSGRQLWKARLGGEFSASPILAGEHIYCPNEAGVTYVYKAAESFEKVAENDLGNGGFASPTICGGRIYLRTSNRLYCIGAADVAATGDAPAVANSPAPEAGTP